MVELGREKTKCQRRIAQMSKLRKVSWPVKQNELELIHTGEEQKIQQRQNRLSA
jgi:hypothetical protein